MRNVAIITIGDGKCKRCKVINAAKRENKYKIRKIRQTGKLDCTT